MQEDPIIEEVRLHREQHAARFNYDLLATYQNIKEQEHDSKKHFISYSKSHLGANLKARKTKILDFMVTFLFRKTTNIL
jgi:hypothetical protein